MKAVFYKKDSNFCTYGKVYEVIKIIPCTCYNVYQVEADNGKISFLSENDFVLIKDTI